MRFATITNLKPLAILESVANKGDTKTSKMGAVKRPEASQHQIQEQQDMRSSYRPMPTLSLSASITESSPSTPTAAPHWQDVDPLHISSSQHTPSHQPNKLSASDNTCISATSLIPPIIEYEGSDSTNPSQGGWYPTDPSRYIHDHQDPGSLLPELSPHNDFNPHPDCAQVPRLKFQCVGKVKGNPDTMILRSSVNKIARWKMERLPCRMEIPKGRAARDLSCPVDLDEVSHRLREVLRIQQEERREGASG